MTKMDKYKDLLEDTNLSERFKKSFLAAKGIFTSGFEEDDNPKINDRKIDEEKHTYKSNVGSEKEQKETDFQKTNLDKNEKKIIFEDVTRKVEERLSDETKGVLKDKAVLLNKFNPNLSVQLDEDLNNFFNQMSYNKNDSFENALKSSIHIESEEQISNFSNQKITNDFSVSTETNQKSINDKEKDDLLQDIEQESIVDMNKQNVEEQFNSETQCESETLEASNIILENMSNEALGDSLQDVEKESNVDESKQIIETQYKDDSFKGVEISTECINTELENDLLQDIVQESICDINKQNIEEQTNLESQCDSETLEVSNTNLENMSDEVLVDSLQNVEKESSVDVSKQSIETQYKDDSFKGVETNVEYIDDATEEDSFKNIEQELINDSCQQNVKAQEEQVYQNEGNQNCIAEDDFLNDDFLKIDDEFDFDLEAEAAAIKKIFERKSIKEESNVSEHKGIEKPDFSNREVDTSMNIYDNFYYLKDLNSSLYEKIKQTESSLIHNHVEVVQCFSNAIDEFCDSAIKADLQTICDKKMLGPSFNYDRIKTENNENIVCLNDIKIIETLLNKKVSLENDSFKKYICIVNDHKVISGRILRNGLKSFDVVLRAFYEINDNKKWNKDAIKIDNFDIYKITTKALGCKKEYFGVDLNATPNTYAVIKEYNIQNMDMNFARRNISVLERINSNAMDPIEGIAQICQLNEINSEDESYYLSYIFNKKPMLLNQENLNLANTPYERVQMCKRLANAISQLHNLQEPIYHRLINTKSVVLCDFSDKNKGIVPYLINFDFSKLKAADSKSTVLEQFKNQVDSLEQEDTEYVCEYDMSDTSYEKMDVYALGILFIRILSGDLQSTLLNLVDKLNLIEQNYNKKIADLLEWMISEVASDRPSAQKVYAVFNEVYESISLEKNDAIIVTPKEVREDDNVLNDETLPDFDYEEDLNSLHLNESTKEEYIIPMDEYSEDEEFEGADEMASKKEKLDFSYHEPNAPIKVIDNFDYLKDYDQKLYAIVKVAESTCVTNHFDAAKKLRIALDNFLNSVIIQNDLEENCIKFNSINLQSCG